ncbi:MAG: hypothetical protein COA42_04785 [Alteromonadaceae bacterium]|nr:MAG: hypothetical protein COA42_04785 [Alteromonadaceae bacterium]
MIVFMLLNPHRHLNSTVQKPPRLPLAARDPQLALIGLARKVIAVACLFALPVSVSAQEPVSERALVATPTVVLEEKGPKPKKNIPSSRIERSVMPFTHWVEGQIHKTTFTKSSPQIRKNKPKTKTGISLREAISQARQQFKGTILSADKVESDKDLHYLVKILSPDGIIRQIKINGAYNSDKKENNHALTPASTSPTATPTPTSQTQKEPLE